MIPEVPGEGCVDLMRVWESHGAAALKRAFMWQFLEAKWFFYRKVCAFEDWSPLFGSSLVFAP